MLSTLCFCWGLERFRGCFGTFTFFTVRHVNKDLLLKYSIKEYFNRHKNRPKKYGINRNNRLPIITYPNNLNDKKVGPMGPHAPPIL